MDILIFSGQSNMQGQSEALTGTTPIPDAYEYKWLDDAAVPLKNPVGENIRADKTRGITFVAELDALKWIAEHTLGGACYGNTNLVPEFCRAYIAQTGKEVLAVHVAKGSTVIADWMPGTARYAMLVEKVSAAVKKAESLSNVGRIFFIWLQGESDALAGNAKAYYKQKITALCDALKADIGIEKYGIIRVGRFVRDARDDEILAAQDEVCAENDDFLMLTTITETFTLENGGINPYVGGHFSAKGLEKLGAEAGNALGAFVKNSGIR